MANAATPMMKQYQEAKRAAGDALLLFRMGDFYELFFEDAKVAARTLNLALTSRDKGENAVPMAGFPHHQLETYLGRLIAAGMRAAVCEQVEDPKKAVGLVRREVTRVVTPGTLTDDALLDPRANNYLAAVSPGDPVGVAWVEVSTGRFVAAAFPRRQLADQLARIAPAECLVAEDGRAAPRPLGRADDGHAASGLGLRRRHVARGPGQALRHGQPGGLRLRRHGGRPAGGACRRRGPRLPGRDPKDLAGAHRPARSLSRRRRPGDRRGQPPQPGNHPHHPRRPPRGLAAWPCWIRP